MLDIETLQNTIISHFNNRRFSDAEEQLKVLRNLYGNLTRLLAKSLMQIAKQSKIQSHKKLTLLEDAYQLDDNKFTANSYAGMLAKCKKFSQAFSIFEKLLSENPKNNYALNGYGKALAESGNYEKSCKIFERSLAINPNDLIALTSYGKALAESGNYEKSCKIFERSLAINPNDLIALTSYGKALAESGNYDKACDIFESSLAIKEDDIFALNSYGKSLSENENYEKACEVFERSLQIKKNDPIALTGYAETLSRSGNHNEARKIFDRALDINPDDSYALNGYAQMLIFTGEYEKSCEIFERILKTTPNNYNYLKSYAVVLNSYRSELIKKGAVKEDIIKIFEKSMQLDSNNIITLTSYATFLSNNDNFSKASELFEKALTQDNKNSIVLASYGAALAKYTLYDEACQKFEQSLAISPNNIFTLTNYGKSLIQNRKIDDAIIQFRKVLSINSSDAIARYLYATVLQENGNYIEAINEFKSVDFTKLDKGLDDIINLNLGRLYYQLKQPIEGRKYFDIVLQSYVNQDVGKLRIAASILAAEPFSNEGIAMLKEVIETSPKYQQARQLLSLNLDSESHYEAFKNTEEESHTDTASLNRAMYHKIQNEIAILKELVYDLISDFSSEELIFPRILENISNIFEGIKQRRNQEESKIKAIPHHNYTQLLTAISQTAHDIVDFVGNKLAAIKEDIWETLSETEKKSPLYQSLNQLLQRIENTQSALNDLKAVNEGIRIKNTTFTITELFSIWMNTPKIRHAQINLNLINAEDIINTDKEKIKSFLNELVENSLKHNPDKNDLVISMKTEMSNNPNIPSLKINKKYLHIIFTDNGEGVAKDKKEWIFLPLASTSAKGEGSGLGLFMIKRILKELHGYISESGNNGVKFDIYIPYEA